MTPDSLKFDVNLSGTFRLNGMSVEAGKAALLAHIEEQMENVNIGGIALLTLEASQETIQVKECDRVALMDDDEAVATCAQARVRLVQASEPEVLGRWDWIDDNGTASECSFESEGDAARDAIRTLNLLEEAGFDTTTLHHEE